MNRPQRQDGTDLDEEYIINLEEYVDWLEDALHRALDNSTVVKITGISFGPIPHRNVVGEIEEDPFDKSTN